MVFFITEARFGDLDAREMRCLRTRSLLVNALLRVRCVSMLENPSFVSLVPARRFALLGIRKSHISLESIVDLSNDFISKLLTDCESSVPALHLAGPVDCFLIELTVFLLSLAPVSVLINVTLLFVSERIDFWSPWNLESGCTSDSCEALVLERFSKLLESMLSCLCD